VATSSTILILSAWEPEIAPLRAWLARPTARVLARSVRCRPVGVGAVDAGIGAARAIADVGPARVIFVGTAGSYVVTGGALPIGTVALPEELVLCSTATLRADGYLPAPMIQRAPVAADLLADLRRTAPEAARGSAATTLAITRTAALARRIARATGAVAENLESFAVARAAARTDVPAAVVLGIANRVGPRAHSEWRRHHEAASKAACQVVWACLRDT
jgi:purine-nucleoside phosphorylase